MTGEFRIAKGWRIFIYAFSPLLIGVFLYAGYVTMRSENTNPWMTFFLAPLSFGLVLLFTYWIIETKRGRIIIRVDSISRLSTLGTRVLSFSEIKGFRTDDNYIHIVANDETKKSIQISLYTEKAQQILIWLDRNFQDLDRHEEEENQILNDEEFGMNRQAREFRLNEARRTAKYINIAGSTVGIWLLVYPTPYVPISLATMIVPLAALCSVYAFRGLIRFDDKKGSAFPSIFLGFLMPCSALTVRALMDWNILEYQRLWVSVSISTVVLSGLFLIGTKELVYSKLSHIFAALVLVVFTLGYTYGTYVISNCVLDQSAPHEYKVGVLDKETGSARVTTYDVVVSPWGHETEPRELSVTKRQFDKLSKGDTVVLHVRQGFFRTPWLYVLTE